MIRATVGEVVEAGVCPRRFALARAGASRERPHGTPVGALVHECARAFVAGAATDDELSATLAAERPSPDAVHRRVAALMDGLFVDRVSVSIDRFRADDLQRGGRAVRDLARLLSTAIRRARVAGAPPTEAAARALPAAERPFTLSLATPDGPVEIAGRFDLLVRNDVDGRLEVWELKTWIDSSGAADEQAALYALALAELEPSGLRPAVLQLAGDGRVVLRAVAPLDAAKRESLIARLLAMAGWAAAPELAPPTDDRSNCVGCPFQAPCWQLHGSTLGAPPSAVDVLIGHSTEKRPKKSSPEEVRWTPGHAEHPLSNFGFLVTGDSGKGKTQTVRALISALRAAGLPVLIFDFKNDYSDSAFASTCGLTVYDVRDRGLPWNPLTLIPERESTGSVVRPREQAHQVASILGRILGLGVQQEAALRRAMHECYAARGLDSATFPTEERLAGPGFAEVVAAADHPTLRARLEPLVDLGLLRDDAPLGDLPTLLSGGTVLDLHKVVDERFKTVLAELALLALHGHLLAGDQPRRLTRLVVIDEAHRVAGSEVLTRLLREGRAFGAGFAIATQYPGDLSDEVAGALETKLFFNNDQEAHRAAVARHLIGTASGPQATELKRALQALAPLEGYFVNTQYRPWRRVRVVPHHARGAG